MFRRPWIPAFGRMMVKLHPLLTLFRHICAMDHPVIEQPSRPALARERDAFAAICRSQAVIELGLDGTVLWANQLFLDMMGYELAEIAGQHHRMFCSADYAQSIDYRHFWEKLAAGSFDGGE
jgi:PAS domain-containing protein